jgi:hypothetical protein
MGIGIGILIDFFMDWLVGLIDERNELREKLNKREGK